MKQDAISKLKTEMDQNKSNPYIQVVGGFLLQHLEGYPESAENILAGDKTIRKSLDAMKSEASKKKVDNCAVLTDEEGFAVVLKYFGIEEATPTPAKVEIAAGNYRPVPPVPIQKSIDFDISLEDLL